jgi:hypothetical protein
MKNIFSCSLLFIALLATTAMHAQGAHDANVHFAKTDRPGIIAEFPYSQGIVENALRARLEAAGIRKPKSEKGFESYQGVSWADMAPGQVDVYTKVDGKDNQSTVVLLVSKGYDNYVSASSDPALNAKLKAWLDALLPDIQAGQRVADIGAQEEAVRRAEKAYKDADNDGNKLARDRERIDKELADNTAEKAKRADALNAEKAKLDLMKAQVK